jgi:hypothetical protein
MDGKKCQRGAGKIGRKLAPTVANRPFGAKTARPATILAGQSGPRVGDVTQGHFSEPRRPHSDRNTSCSI